MIYTSKKQHDSTVNEIKSDILLIKKDSKDLEDKQEKHNKVIERVYQLEIATELLEERQKVANNRIKDLERKVENE